ncbi:MAG TPA: SDR family NAD(P)-dependent oxidoreductase [Halothiobacillaceae bacterium]|nr:SDR family NAD(P)-dependent oxidoreductase [Halothiobacillaceae bacterium]
MTQQHILITGNSSGLGWGLTRAFLKAGHRVYGLSRRGAPETHPNLFDTQCDLTDFEQIDPALSQLLTDTPQLDLIFLNAGRLGEIRDMSDTPVDDLREIMEINVWANKIIFDWLLEHDISVTQIIAISSGASVLGNRGWGGYALSKSGLNMLCRLYAHEMPATHISAIAPGLIDSQMIEYLSQHPEKEKFPALKRIATARQDGSLLSPAQAAQRIIKALPTLKTYESGHFIDLREILAPDEYAKLMAARNQAGKS